ncbi:MAG: kinase/pyrophosphorylase [Deltaproteobacteria bacterium]|nr:kinase/pyrophosphorylase [Deltaproteobacteria bacterium]
MDQEKPKELRIIVLSDGTGETAAQITRAAIVQFSDKEIYFTRYKNIRTKAQVEAIFEDAAIHHDMVVYTIVSPDLREFMQHKAAEKNIPAVDILGPLLNAMGGYFHMTPKSLPGLFHQVNDRYFKRIEAMEYTIAHDDGRDLTGMEKADIILLGISRTSKTPLSMYLSHQGWKVINVPIILGFDLPPEVYEADQRKIVALTISADTLSTIRKARLERLGQDDGGDYASIDKVIEEIDYADQIFRKNKRWPVFNVTGKALEETASEIIKLMVARRKQMGLPTPGEHS